MEDTTSVNHHLKHQKRSQGAPTELLLVEYSPSPMRSPRYLSETEVPKTCCRFGMKVRWWHREDSVQRAGRSFSAFRENLFAVRTPKHWDKELGESSLWEDIKSRADTCPGHSNTARKTDRHLQAPSSSPHRSYLQ